MKVSLFWDERILMTMNILSREVTFLICHLRTMAMFTSATTKVSGKGLSTRFEQMERTQFKTYCYFRCYGFKKMMWSSSDKFYTSWCIFGGG